MQKTEKEIIFDCINGNTIEFKFLYEKYKDKIFNLTLAILGNYSDAEDALQDTFIRAYISLKSFRMESNFLTWIYRIAINRCRDILKKNKRNGQRVQIENNNIEALLIYKNDDNSENLKEVINVMLKLKPKYREVITMKFINDLSYKEMKKVLGIPESILRVRVARAIKKLKNIIKNGDKDVRKF